MNYVQLRMKHHDFYRAGFNENGLNRNFARKTYFSQKKEQYYFRVSTFNMKKPERNFWFQ